MSLNVGHEQVLTHSSETRFQLDLSSAKTLKFLYFATAASAVLIYLLISLGGLVRSAGAGLSCPDWPLCHGQIVPVQMFSDQLHATPTAQIPGHVKTPVAAHATGFQIFLEWFHRLIAGGISIIMLVISGIVFFNTKYRKKYSKYCALALFLLTAQVIMGGLTVLGLLSPKWVVSHLIIGLAFFSTVIWTTLKFKQSISPQMFTKTLTDPRLRTLAVVSLVALGIQIFLGGLVSSNYAGLACPDFPTCNGAWIPPMEGLVKFQFLHRVGAFLTTAVLVYFGLKALMFNFNRRAKFALWLMPLLISTQILLGIGLIRFELPLLMSVAHLAIATALLGCLWILSFEIFAAKKQVYQ